MLFTNTESYYYKTCFLLILNHTTTFLYSISILFLLKGLIYLPVPFADKEPYPLKVAQAPSGT